MARHASVHLTDIGGTILVDGQDISRCVRSLTLTGDVRTGTRLELGLVLGEVQHEGQTQVYLPARVAELLTALGWTPPADYDPTAADLHPLPKLQHDEALTAIDQSTIASEPVPVLPEQAYADLVRWASRYFPPDIPADQQGPSRLNPARSARSPLGSAEVF
ncbi:hypothetical protein [Streptomyces microflavus]|uniref:hypothetical protein n=1 Tax=Streptomyces microflavus TaxID=1919 RepID=UPI003245DCC4